MALCLAKKKTLHFFTSGSPRAIFFSTFDFSNYESNIKSKLYKHVDLEKRVDFHTTFVNNNDRIRRNPVAFLLKNFVDRRRFDKQWPGFLSRTEMSRRAPGQHQDVAGRPRKSRVRWRLHGSQPIWIKLIWAVSNLTAKIASFFLYK